MKLAIHNKGLSDQIYSDFQIRITNRNFHVLKQSNGRLNPKEDLFDQKRFTNLPLNLFKSQKEKNPDLEAAEGHLHPNSGKDIRTNLYFVNGMKSRSKLTIEIPCEFENDFQLKEDQNFDTTVEYDEFGTSIRSK